MHAYECMVAETDGGLFETAVYRFLEVHPTPSESSVSMHTEVRSAGKVKSVHLWSARAVEDFDRHWQRFRHERLACLPGGRR